MEKLNRLEILVSLRNEQLEKVINREVSLKLLQEMAAQDPSRVLRVDTDMEALRPKPVTVQMRLNEMKEAFDIDVARLKMLEKEIAEEEKLNTPKEVDEGPQEEKK